MSGALPSAGTAPPVWKWQGDRGYFRAYDVATLKLVEEAYRAGKPSIALTTGYFGDHPGYEIDFATSTQVHHATLFRRPVVRNNTPVMFPCPDSLLHATPATPAPLSAAAPPPPPPALAKGASVGSSSSKAGKRTKGKSKAADPDSEDEDAAKGADVGADAPADVSKEEGEEGEDGTGAAASGKGKKAKKGSVGKAPVHKKGKTSSATPSAPVTLDIPEAGELLDRLLSSACSTDKKDSMAALLDDPSIKTLSDKDLTKMLKENVPDIEVMFDRLGVVPVTKYIIQTYKSGLPAFSGNAFVLEHSRKSMRFVFHALQGLPPKARSGYLKMLAEAYQACQAEQGRVVDYLFGVLSGRDKGLQDQLLALVDTQKQRTLDIVTASLHPSAASSGDGSPQNQLPHIQSRYRTDIADELGLRGKSAGELDPNKPAPLTAAARKKAIQLFRDTFSLLEIAQALVADVNQQDAEAERIVYRDTLAKWAGEAASGSPPFDAFSIYYDEEHPERYDGRPSDANMYEPYLSLKVAQRILVHVFLNK